MTAKWSPDTWRAKEIRRVPQYPDKAALAEAEAQLSRYPPLVFAGEARRLKEQLGQVAAGKAFLLQGGDCAESFDDCTSDSIVAKLKILLQMSLVML